jgi:predicted metal-dependent hydrolase
MNLSDLPEIQIKRHIKATRLRLRVELNQIKLTAPIFCSKKQIQNFIDQSEQWLIETWKKQQKQHQSVERTLPIELQLFDLEQPLKITYQTQKRCFLLDEDSNQLLISDRQPEQYLKNFIIEYAKEKLPLYLRQVSEQSNLPFNECAIRQPKTRWGSCTSKHDIMLNSGLVLFPKVIVRYVCVHELAHTRHFDHSQYFWNEVAKYDENFQAHRKYLKAYRMPWWWS